MGRLWVAAVSGGFRLGLNGLLRGIRELLGDGGHFRKQSHKNTKDMGIK
jgi:hypothetical protein